MQSKAQLSAGLFVVVSLLGCISYSSQAPSSRAVETKPKVSTANVQEVLGKLENYALSKTSTSGLTLLELEAAHREYESWNKEVRNTLKAEEPLIHLLVDFLFLPMSKYPNLLHTPGDPAQSKKLAANYIARLEYYYKEFRPAFLGEMVGDSFRVCKKTEALLPALLNLNGAKPLTRRMLLDAKVEHDAYAERLSDIELYEDIFSNLQELKLTLNYLNRFKVELLRDKIFPLVSEVKTDEQAQELKSVYLAAMRELSYDVQDGELVYIRRSG